MDNKKSSMEKAKWFTEARFGMFIHWGLYALPARHEWVRNQEKITTEDYQKYFDHFDPDLFNPSEWAKMAKNAGMKYFVVTTKHHEGFCLWDTAYTGYKAPNTKAGRDLLREIIDAFRAEGLRIGLYYSLIDWHHPDFTVDCYHPLREMEGREEHNRKCDMSRYRKYMRDQVTELLTNYGKIDIMWFDFSYRDKGHEDWGSKELATLVRSLQPDILIDNRLDLPEEADIQTPEQYVPNEPVLNPDGSIAVWEGCHTLSGSWGYHRDELTWKSAKQAIEILVRNVSLGGNLIMNVGPTARGYFDSRAVERLEDYARWMKYNSASIYGCTIAPECFKAPEGAVYTYNPEKNRLYMHILSWPFVNVHVPSLKGKIEYVQFLHDASEVRHCEYESDVVVTLPVIKPQVEIPVLEIFLKS